MTDSPVDHHTQYRKVLEPVFEMLEFKEKTLPRDKWIDMVNNTKQRILLAPDQFLASGCKPSDELKGIVEKIFRDRLN